MKIISFSDLHLEFGAGFVLPRDLDADVMILAGDIITLKEYEPLSSFLGDWKKPVLYVLGNHEFYTRNPMTEDVARFKAWLADRHPNVTFLQDEAVCLDGVNFFGGTMWTWFADGNPQAMDAAQNSMNDFRLIHRFPNTLLAPIDTVSLHDAFVKRLLGLFASKAEGPCVVVSHHAPILNPKTQYGNSPIMPAFNSLDMLAIIEKHQPDLWIYGHTHECDDQTIGKIRVISNQLGYPKNTGGFECAGFDARGCPVDI